MRLNRYLAMCGIGSRRKCDKLISEGLVEVNGKVIKDLATIVNPKKDIVLFRGKQVKRQEYVYIIMNKPRNYITSVTDTHNRPTVLDLIKNKECIDERIYPVGRLDYDTEGLLLLTNDGLLSHRLMHPKYRVDKEYYVEINGILTESDVQKLENGIVLEEGKTSAAKIKIVNTNENIVKLYITIHQGWKRQIKRMFASIGKEVIYLKRTKIGPLKLGDLKTGEFRKLTSEELLNLKRVLKLNN